MELFWDIEVKENKFGINPIKLHTIVKKIKVTNQVYG